MNGKRAKKAPASPKAKPGVSHDGRTGAAARTRASGNTSSILGLQHNAGNQAVGQMLKKTGSGQPLDPATRISMEAHLGHSLHDVRVYSNPAAAGLAKSLKAKAFTLGTDIGFGGGYYAPHTTKGKQLLTHELVHVAQQRGAAPSAGIDFDPAAEREAANLSVETDCPLADTTIKSRSGGIQRTPEDEKLPPAQQKSLQELIGKYGGRLRSSGGAIEETWRRTHSAHDNPQRRGAAAELGTIEDALKHGVQGKEVIFLDVVPSRKGGRTVDLRATLSDGTTHEIEVTAATAAPQRRIPEVKGLGAREELAGATQERFAGPSDVRDAIWRKAKPGTAKKPSQFKQKGTVVVVLPFTRVKASDVDKAVSSFDEAGKQLSPNVERIVVSIPEERASPNEKLRKTNLEYVRTETGFKRQPSTVEGQASPPTDPLAVPAEKPVKPAIHVAGPEQPVAHPVQVEPGEEAKAQQVSKKSSASATEIPQPVVKVQPPDVALKTKAKDEPETHLGVGEHEKLPTGTSSASTPSNKAYVGFPSASDKALIGTLEGVKRYQARTAVADNAAHAISFVLDTVSTFLGDLHVRLGAEKELEKQKRWIQATLDSGLGVFVNVRYDQSKHENNNGQRVKFFAAVHTFAARSYDEGLKMWLSTSVIEQDRGGVDPGKVLDNFDRVSSFSFIAPRAAKSSSEGEPR